VGVLVGAGVGVLVGSGVGVTVDGGVLGGRAVPAVDSAVETTATDVTSGSTGASVGTDEGDGRREQAASENRPKRSKHAAKIEGNGAIRLMSSLPGAVPVSARGHWTGRGPSTVSFILSTSRLPHLSPHPRGRRTNGQRLGRRGASWEA